MNPSRRKLRAVHEAAHAVGCESNGWPVTKVVLREERGLVAGVPSSTTGMTEARHPKPSIEFVGLLVGVALCGYAAVRGIEVEQVEMEQNIKETGLDWQTIENYFKELHLEPGQKLVALYEGVAEAANIINENIDTINKLADVLVETSEISGDDVRRIIAEEKQVDTTR